MSEPKEPSIPILKKKLLEWMSFVAEHNTFWHELGHIVIILDISHMEIHLHSGMNCCKLKTMQNQIWYFDQIHEQADDIASFLSIHSKECFHR